MEPDSEAIIFRFDTYKTCLSCGGLMDPAGPIGVTGGDRSLLEWYRCDECQIWCALCKRTEVSHMIVSAAGNIQEWIWAWVNGPKNVTPMLNNAELQACWQRGHLPAFRLN